jgi:hypothetical protein
MIVCGQLHSSASLLRRKELLIPLDRRLGKFQNGLDVVEKRKSLILAGNRTPTSQSSNP